MSEREAHPTPGRAPWRVALSSLAAVLVAAALVVAILPQGGEGGVRAELRFRRGGEVQLAAADQRFQAGDQLMLRLVDPPEGHLYLFTVDERAQVLPVIVGGQLRGVPVPAGGAWDLPGSLTMDGAPGEDRLYVLLLPDPRPWAEIRTALREQVASPDARVALDDALLLQSFLLRKD